MTSDFPRVAALMSGRWEALGGDALDGVVIVDVVSMGYMLQGQGAIEFGDVTLDEDNVAESLLKGVTRPSPSISGRGLRDRRASDGLQAD